MIETRVITNKSDWEEFLKSRPDANFLQSWYWGEFHQRLHKRIVRLGFYQDGVLRGALLGIIEKARRGRYMTIPAGPIIDWGDEALTREVFVQIRRIAAEERCVFVRIRPQMLENEQSKTLFKKYGFLTAPMHLHAELTSRLKISEPPDVILSNMRKTTRYEIRKAEKLGIKISTSTSASDVKQFYEYQLETARRQKFVPFSYPFFHEQFSVFFEADLAVLYTATLQKKVLAQAFIIFYNTEAVYHYGIGTNDGRQYPGAYLIQWEAIKEAQKRNMQYYNFWGVAPATNRTHRFYTISIFKRGFGGEDTQYLRAQDMVINKPLYALNFTVEKVRKLVRRV